MKALGPNTIRNMVCKPCYLTSDSSDAEAQNSPKSPLSYGFLGPKSITSESLEP